MAKQPLSGVEWINSRQKRAMDIAYSLNVLPLLAPIGASALALSRLIDGKGVVFSHQRIGQQSQLFDVYKVRTLKNTGPDVPSTGTYDTHATALGRLLRPLAIDEIPQLINILRGEMSVVGPRAAYRAVFKTMQDILPRNLFDEWLESYSLSKPGGISSAAINNRVKHGPFEELYRQKAELDIIDFQNTSFRYDNKLIARASVVIARLALHRQVEESEEIAAGNTDLAP